MFLFILGWGEKKFLFDLKLLLKMLLIKKSSLIYYENKRIMRLVRFRYDLEKENNSLLCKNSA